MKVLGERLKSLKGWEPHRKINKRLSRKKHIEGAENGASDGPNPVRPELNYVCVLVFNQNSFKSIVKQRKVVENKCNVFLQL